MIIKRPIALHQLGHRVPYKAERQLCGEIRIVAFYAYLTVNVKYCFYHYILIDLNCKTDMKYAYTKNVMVYAITSAVV